MTVHNFADSVLSKPEVNTAYKLASSKVITGNLLLFSIRAQGQEFVWEELPPDTSTWKSPTRRASPHRQPSQERAVASPVSQCSSAYRYPTPNPTPVWSRNVSPVPQPRQDKRSVVSSLRNGTPSPWINRYKLKQKSNSMLNVYDMKRKSQTQALQPVFRVYSR